MNDRARQVADYHAFLISRPTPGRLALADRLLRHEAWLKSTRALRQATELTDAMSEMLVRICQP